MNGRERVRWNLRRLRVAKGLSQEALAVDANVDRSYISGIEGGSFNPSIGVLDSLAAALGADVAEFLIEPAPGDPVPQPLTPGRKPPD